MKKNNINPNAHGAPYIIRSSVKPANVVIASNNNTILKISKEVNFLYNLIQYAVKSQERTFFLILTEDPLLDIENLKQYLMEKELTEFAKKEIIKISEIINNAILLQSEYEKIPMPKYFTEYNFTEKKGDGARGAVNGSLFYIIITKNGIIKSDENSFRNECDKLPYFYMLDTYKILNTFNELVNLIKLNPTPLDTDTNTGNENEGEDKVKPYNNIFEGNAFELFKYYFENKHMENNSRTQFRFLYEVMKADGFIYNTVTLGQYITFIKEECGYTDSTLKSINLESKPNKNNLGDYNRYKTELKIRSKHTPK